MKEQMYSCIDTQDEQRSLVWVHGDVMAVSTDSGSDDLWKFKDNCEIDDIFEYATESIDLERFYSMQLIWEREV